VCRTSRDVEEIESVGWLGLERKAEAEACLESAFLRMSKLALRVIGQG
jgi:hypothetical protein